MGKNLYYCLLWFNFHDEPMTKFMWADCQQELVSDYLAAGYVALSITDITNRKVEDFNGV